MSYFKRYCRMCHKHTDTMSGICDDCYDKEIELLDALRNSVAMWEWLRDHPGSNKEDYFIENGIYDDESWPMNGCHLCEYCKDPNSFDPDCSKCPGNGVLWRHIPGTSGCTSDKKSPFANWVDAINDEYDTDLNTLVSSASAMVAGLKQFIEKIEEVRRNG